MKTSFAIILTLSIGLTLMALVGKNSVMNKLAATNWKIQSTGLAAIVYDTTRAAEFVGHYDFGSGSTNSLYQGFLALHFDELDSLRTFHSRVGRTNNSRIFPGDSNSFSPPTALQLLNSPEVESYQLTFSPRNWISQFQIRQIVTTYKDSTNIIYVSFIFDFPARSLSDTIQFTNLRILFGYDGDIGTTTGGYSDDTSGYYEDPELAIAYVADTSSRYPVYAGMSLINHRSEALPGNIALLHQTVNDSGQSLQDLDTMLFGFMTTPSFSPDVGHTDVSIYWTVNFGTIVPVDTVRDTLRLAFVNASSLANLLLAARGLRLPLDDGVNPPNPTDRPKARLYQNVPNPFNPVTAIRYQIAEAGEVRMDIYNVLGQRVRRLVNARQEKNDYEVIWDGTNEHGVPVTSGVYFYRLVTPAVTLTRRMLFVK